MTLTLNQIIDRIEAICLSHKQVETFVLLKESIGAYLSDGDKVYPAILCEIQDGGGIDRASKQVHQRCVHPGVS